MFAALFLLFWLTCGVGAAGGFLAMWHHDFPRHRKQDYRQNLGGFLFLGFFGGPIAFLISLFFSGFFQHGWTLLPPKE